MIAANPDRRPGVPVAPDLSAGGNYDTAPDGIGTLVAARIMAGSECVYVAVLLLRSALVATPEVAQRSTSRHGEVAGTIAHTGITRSR